MLPEQKEVDAVTRNEMMLLVEQYFASITRVKQLMEPVATDEKDEYGHTVYTDVPVTNILGGHVYVTEYLIPPTESDLCAFMGMSSAEWNKAKVDKKGKLVPAAQVAMDKIRAYLDREMLVRSGKNTKGVQFTLNTVLGVTEKNSVELRAGKDGKGGAFEVIVKGGEEYSQ